MFFGLYQKIYNNISLLKAQAYQWHRHTLHGCIPDFRMYGKAWRLSVLCSFSR